MKKIVATAFIGLLLSSCSKERIIQICSIDKSECITIIDKEDDRYIINGTHTQIPKANYVKINTENIDDLGDAIQVCWNDNGYKWSLVNDKSVILESTLDTTKFKFYTKLPTDDRGIPHQKDYVKENCGVYDFHTLSLLYDKGAIVVLSE